MDKGFFLTAVAVFVGVFFKPSANGILLVLVPVVEHGTRPTWRRRGRAPAPFQSLSPGQAPPGQMWGVNRLFFFFNGEANKSSDAISSSLQDEPTDCQNE